MQEYRDDKYLDQTTSQDQINNQDSNNEDNHND